LKARIILPTDGSEPARWAAEFVCRTLRVPAAGCDVTVVHVDTPFPVRARSVLGREVVQELHERASSKTVESARRLLDRQRVAHEAVFLVGNSGEQVAGFARERRADLLVMGARGLGAFRAFVLGSTSQRVLAGCPVPAIVIRKPPARRVVRKVLIATDGSDSSARAVRAFLKLRRLFHPEPRVTLVHAVMPISPRVAVGLKLGPRDRYYASLARTATAGALALLRRQRLRCEEVMLLGDPGRAIADHATRGRFDLVVMGSHGRGAAKALVLGSVAQRVLARCTVPALVVR
jgi:nucleotide-binding universal stress UspA family protein